MANKPNRQKWIAGSVVKIPVNQNQWSYGILLEESTIEIKKILTSTEQSIEQIVGSKKLFRQTIYNDIVSRGLWKKVGKTELIGDLAIEEEQYVQDQLSGELFLYHSRFAEQGYMRSCTLKEVQGLEPVTVAEANHVIDRIVAEMSGKEDPWKINIDVKKYNEFIEGKSD